MEEKKPYKPHTPESYEKQVKTFIRKHGKRRYAMIGSKGGGKNSPGSFNSDTAREAALKGWEKRRQRAIEKLKQEKDNGSKDN